MGDIKKKQKKFRRPKDPFDKPRIEEENSLAFQYGLKNKKEIWKAESAIRKIRRRAKSLIPKTEDEKKSFFDKLNKMGLRVETIADVLGLTKENLLARRLQTIVFKKKLSNTIKQARQMIVHKEVLIDGKVVNIPSFEVTITLEAKIGLKERAQKKKKDKEKIVEEEKKDEVENE